MAGIEPACESVMREPATNLVQSIWDSELKTEQKTHCPARIDFPQTSSNQRNQRELELWHRYFLSEHSEGDAALKRKPGLVDDLSLHLFRGGVI